jgi:hypothetical protein
MSDNPFKYTVSEYDGIRSSILHGGGPSYREARSLAVRLSAQDDKHNKGFRIVDPEGNTIAVAMNGEVTNPDGTGPDIDPEAIVGAVRVGANLFQSIYTRDDRKIRVFLMTPTVPSPATGKGYATAATGVWNEEAASFVWDAGVTMEPGALMMATSWLRGRLNAERIARHALVVLNQRGVSDKCPRCGHDEWDVESFGMLVRPDPFPMPPAFLNQGQQTPVVGLICRTCGWMAIHSLRALGVGP